MVRTIRRICAAALAAALTATPISYPVMAQSPSRPPRVQQAKRNAAAKQQLYAQRLARVQAKGGSPLHAIFLHQLERYLTAQSPANDLEKAAFAHLAKVPRAALTEYWERWRNLPANDKKALLGGAESALSANVPLSAEQVKPLLPPAALATPDADAQPIALDTTRSLAARRVAPRPRPRNCVQTVRVSQIYCVDETGGEGIFGQETYGDDEIFVVYLAGSGRTVLDKTTAIYEGFSDQTARAVSARDATVWPSTRLACSDDVTVTATVIEDDSTDISWRAVVHAAVRITAGIVGVVTGTPAPGALVGAVNDLVDAVIADRDAEIIGTDFLIAKRNGTTVGANGRPKRIFNVAGLGGHYQLKGVQVTTVRR